MKMSAWNLLTQGCSVNMYMYSVAHSGCPQPLPSVKGLPLKLYNTLWDGEFSAWNASKGVSWPALVVCIEEQGVWSDVYQGSCSSSAIS